MLEVFRENEMNDELLWFAFTSTFRPHSIAYISKDVGLMAQTARRLQTK